MFLETRISKLETSSLRFRILLSKRNRSRQQSALLKPDHHQGIIGDWEGHYYFPIARFLEAKSGAQSSFKIA